MKQLEVLKKYKNIKIKYTKLKYKIEKIKNLCCRNDNELSKKIIKILCEVEK